MKIVFPNITIIFSLISEVQFVWERVRKGNSYEDELPIAHFEKRGVTDGRWSPSAENYQKTVSAFVAMLCKKAPNNRERRLHVTHKHTVHWSSSVFTIKWNKPNSLVCSFLNKLLTARNKSEALASLFLFPSATLSILGFFGDASPSSRSLSFLFFIVNRNGLKVLNTAAREENNFITCGCRSPCFHVVLIYNSCSTH